MKRQLLLGLSLLLSAGFAKAQFSPFNRLTDVKLDTTATFSHNGTGTGTVLRNSPSSTQFFPHPASKYVARGLFSNVASTDLSLSPSKVTMKNPTSGLVKSSFYNFQNPNGVVKFAFTLDLTNYTGAATFVVSLGNEDTPSRLISASTSYAAASSDVFGSFRIANGGSAGRTQYKNATGGDVLLTLAQSLIKVGVSQNVEIFVNSTASGTTYTHVSSGTPIALAANTYHIYVDNVAYGIDFPKNGTTYTQAVLDGITFEFNNNATQETVSISNISATYPSAVDPTLPVNLTSFTGKKAANGVTLNWSTASEENNDYFTIARSTDGQSFSTIKTVKGKGTTSGMNSYSFTDNLPAVGTNYYQLSQVDKDGTTTVFKDLVAINYELSGDKFAVYASGDKLNVSAYAEKAGSATLSVFDLQGKKVYATTVRLSAGQNAITVDAGNIGSGIFVANLVGSEAAKSVKFTKK